MPRKRIVNVILDTNWYISASINRESRRRLYRLLTDPNIQIIFSKEILREYHDVIDRPKFQNIITKGQALRFINLVLPFLKEVAITTSTERSRDAKDNHLLALLWIRKRIIW
jgi:putative PIN family toxin of toxin-antitoxin system